MPLFEPTLCDVPDVAEEPTPSVKDLLVPVETDSVTPLAIDWLVPRVSVIPLETPLDIPLVKPLVFVADTESLTPAVVPDATDRLWPTPLESESVEPRAAAVLDEVPKESVSVLLVEADAEAVEVDELVPPSEYVLLHELEEPVVWLVPAVALLFVPLEELDPDEPPTKPSNPPFTPDDDPSAEEVPFVELLEEPLDELEPPPVLEPPDQLVPEDSPVETECPVEDPSAEDTPTEDPSVCVKLALVPCEVESDSETPEV